VEYQASSPDEVALVKFAESLEMRLIERDQHKIVIRNAAKEEETYEILANFPFSSETKRMGIILRHQVSGRLIFYLKGAETVMKNKVRPN
jgi:phospholipid-translocating ATPase